MLEVYFHLEVKDIFSTCECPAVVSAFTSYWVIVGLFVPLSFVEFYFFFDLCRFFYSKPLVIFVFVVCTLCFQFPSRLVTSYSYHWHVSFEFLKSFWTWSAWTGTVDFCLTNLFVCVFVFLGAIFALTFWWWWWWFCWVVFFQGQRRPQVHTIWNALDFSSHAVLTFWEALPLCQSRVQPWGKAETCGRCVYSQGFYLCDKSASSRPRWWRMCLSLPPTCL